MHLNPFKHTHIVTCTPNFIHGIGKKFTTCYECSRIHPFRQVSPPVINKKSKMSHREVNKKGN